MTLQERTEAIKIIVSQLHTLPDTDLLNVLKIVFAYVNRNR